MSEGWLKDSLEASSERAQNLPEWKRELVAARREAMRPDLHGRGPAEGAMRSEPTEESEK